MDKFKMSIEKKIKCYENLKKSTKKTSLLALFCTTQNE